MREQVVYYEKLYQLFLPFSAAVNEGKEYNILWKDDWIKSLAFPPAFLPHLTRRVMGGGEESDRVSGSTFSVVYSFAL